MIINSSIHKIIVIIRRRVLLQFSFIKKKNAKWKERKKKRSWKLWSSDGKSRNLESLFVIFRNDDFFRRKTSRTMKFERTIQKRKKRNEHIERPFYYVKLVGHNYKPNINMNICNTIITGHYFCVRQSKIYRFIPMEIERFIKNNIFRCFFYV